MIGHDLPNSFAGPRQDSAAATIAIDTDLHRVAKDDVDPGSESGKRIV